jgi:feruloyl esterase
MKRALVMASLVVLAACSQPDKTASVTMPTKGGDCAALAKLALPGTTISSASVVAAGAFKPAAGPAAAFASVPEFCRVEASAKPTADSDIRFEVWLPTSGWNGKFMGTGNGGAAGAITQTALAEPVKRGYAAANTDTGHTGSGGDFSWTIGHPEKLIDYAWRAVHQMTVAGKAISKAYYSAPPKLSYWFGCSTGGRQGLKEVQRFPADYDGVIAGAPAANWDLLNTHSVQTQLVGTDATSGLPPAKFAVLFEAALKACDDLDGVHDRTVSQPAMCKFDPAVTQCAASAVDTAACLTPAQVASAKKLYAGVVDPVTGKQLFPGTGFTSEPAWSALVGPGFRIGESYYRYVVKQDAKWGAADFKFTDIAAAQKLDAGLLTAMNPDIAPFARRGGQAGRKDFSERAAVPGAGRRPLRRGRRTVDRRLDRDAGEMGRARRGAGPGHRQQAAACRRCAHAAAVRVSDGGDLQGLRFDGRCGELCVCEALVPLAALVVRQAAASQPAHHEGYGKPE